MLTALFSTVYFVLRDTLLLLPWSCQALAVNNAREWRLTQKNGLCSKVYIANDSFVSAYLSILHILPEHSRWFKFWQHRYVLLVSDNTNAAFYRQIRVYLMWGRLAENNTQSGVIEDS